MTFVNLQSQSLCLESTKWSRRFISIGTIDPFQGIVNENNPSRIWIGAELIEFTGIRNTNTLTGLRRGVLGTPIYAHTTAEVVRSASVQHDIPNASKNARWSAFDPVGTTLIDKTEQSTWDMTSWDNDDAPWDKATLDPSEQAIFIRAGSTCNRNLYNTTYAKPGYATPQLVQLDTLAKNRNKYCYGTRKY